MVEMAKRVPAAETTKKSEEKVGDTKYCCKI